MTASGEPVRVVLEDYPRRQHLEFYRRYPNPFYSVTFELEVTALLRRLKADGLPVYAGLVWAFHRALQGLPAFRVRLAGEDVVMYERLQLGLTAPGLRGTFCFVGLQWDEAPLVFLPRAAEAMQRALVGGDLGGGGEAPDAAYYTSLPRVPFTGFTHAPLADPEAGQPEVAFGRFDKFDLAAGVRVPVGVQVNHMYVDGSDLGDLYEAAAESFARAF